MADLPDAFQHVGAVGVGKPDDIHMDELHAAHEFGRIGFLLLDQLGGEREQVAVDLDFHEFAAVTGRGEFAKIHLARRRIGENVQADAGGEDGDGQGITDHCFHRSFIVGLISLFGNPELPTQVIPGSREKVSEQRYRCRPAVS